MDLNIDFLFETFNYDSLASDPVASSPQPRPVRSLFRAQSSSTSPLPFGSNFFARPLIHGFPTAPRILRLLLHCGGRRFHGPTRRTMAALECVSQHLHFSSPNSRRLRCPPAAFCCHKPPPRPPPPPPRTGEMFSRQVSIRALPEQLLACVNRGGPVYRVNRLGSLFPRCANFPL